ncbi:MAG: ribosome-binding factor A [Cyclobacteriaceae bacterium]|nr:ribosome-binding factor A [Cyclobacteriaceae bacterium]
MTSTRQLKFSKLIQKELSEVFQKDQKSIFTGNIISVTQVEMTPDLSVAHVHLGLLLDGDKEKMLEVVQQHKGEIKRSLSRSIGNKYVKYRNSFFISIRAPNMHKRWMPYSKISIFPRQNQTKNRY